MKQMQPKNRGKKLARLWLELNHSFTEFCRVSWHDPLSLDPVERNGDKNEKKTQWNPTRAPGRRRVPINLVTRPASYQRPFVIDRSSAVDFPPVDPIQWTWTRFQWIDRKENNSLAWFLGVGLSRRLGGTSMGNEFGSLSGDPWN